MFKHRISMRQFWRGDLKELERCLHLGSITAARHGHDNFTPMFGCWSLLKRRNRCSRLQSFGDLHWHDCRSICACHFPTLPTSAVGQLCTPVSHIRNSKGAALARRLVEKSVCHPVKLLFLIWEKRILTRTTPVSICDINQGYTRVWWGYSVHCTVVGVEVGTEIWCKWMWTTPR